MNPGKFNRKITIEKYESKEDIESGFPVENWILYKRVFAQKLNIYGTEYYQSKQTKEQVSCKYRFRIFGKIDNTMRIKDNKDIFDILYVCDLKNEGKYYEILCGKRDVQNE